MKERKISKLLTKVLILTAILLTFSTVLMFLLNKWEIVIYLNGNEKTYLEYDTKYTEQGAKAYRQGTIFFFIKEEIPVKIEGTVNHKELSSYTIQYSANEGNLSADKQRTVIVQDTTAPKITLTVNPDSYTLFGHTYEEEGYQATDAYDGDLTDKVIREEKEGKIIYKVIDTHGNKAVAERIIVFDDRKGPEIILHGGNEINWMQGNPFSDSYSAVDDLDGDLTAKVSVTGTVDTNTVGTYTLTYSCKDAHQNETTIQRNIHVTVIPDNTVQAEDHKTIYLTFDDGPSAHTEKLLSILAKYQIPATFFVTGLQPDYIPVIAKIAAAGHVVAEHSYTHQYSEVYANTDAFWNDFNKMNELIYQYAGYYANIFRFPGGSSNTVSRNYRSGIMTALVKQASDKGYTYFDWNVSSGDAGNISTADEVFQNVTSQITNVSANNRPSVVLQHDTKEFSVDAVESIIIWGLQNGYHFSSLSADSFTAHHAVAN